MLNIWDLVTISCNKLIGALINFINKVSCICLLKETKANIIKKLLINTKQILNKFITKYQLKCQILELIQYWIIFS